MADCVLSGGWHEVEGVAVYCSVSGAGGWWVMKVSSGDVGLRFYYCCLSVSICWAVCTCLLKCVRFLVCRWGVRLCRQLLSVVCEMRRQCIMNIGLLLLVLLMQSLVCLKFGSVRTLCMRLLT